LSWITSGTETVGNNVDAHTDTDANNIADLPRPNGGAGLNFDFPLDLALAPSSYKDAAVVQMFYLTNRFHDRLYSLGFNEPAGNYQTNNFGLGGAGNDAIQADVQDGTGTNNANFSTSGTDGSGGRCQMYIWSGPDPDRDGAFESDIVFHELAHGVSIRLHGSLSSSQSGGMGEGWSDFLALSINSQPVDDPNAVYTMGPYATYLLSGLTRNYYFGIRRYPYTTDMNKGPLTLGDIDSALYNVSASVPRSSARPSGSNSGVHDYGEVWCQILWECRAAMIAAHGFAGNELMLQLVIDGMKLAPSNPTFIQSRDAILSADTALTGGANAATLWTAFAKRGIGFGASVPAASSTSGVVESFVVPNLVTFSFPDGLPTQFSPTAVTAFHVDITGSGLTLTPDSGTLSYRIDGGTFTTVPMVSTGTNQYLATIPAQPCLARIDYYVGVGTSLGGRTSPSSAPVAFNAGSVFTSIANLVSDDFETTSGWTTGPDTATTGFWVRGNPNGTAAQPEDDHTPGTGTVCFFTGQGAIGGGLGDADIDGGQVVLNSPVYDLSSVADATVSYWRWYSNGTSASPYSDIFRVQVSTNGGSSWNDAETVGPANSPDTNPGWRFASWTFSSLGLTPTAQVKVRFIAEDAAPGSLVEAALDDFSIVGLECASGPAPCGVADLGQQGGLPGHDGVLDNNDFVAFIDAFFAQSPTADLGIQGGLGGSDGLFDNNDFVVFIDRFFAGC
ncbi:MAG: M36 family metallopeptidase, partial [Phycisphaerales bacterium]|nr:M36 family metallopeptidase [Phycisphaerales bacterium]